MLDSGISVLIVEDERDYATVIESLLTHSLRPAPRLAWAGSMGEAQSRLREQRFDIVLLDLSLPDSKGLQTLGRVRAMAPADTPIIVLTGHAQDEMALRALHEGAQDYLIKTQADGEILTRAMRYAIERKRVDREREALIAELRGALEKIQTLRGLLPICSACKKIRDDKGYWNQIETFIERHSGAEFTHSLCPDCLKSLYPQVLKKTAKGGKAPRQAQPETPAQE